MVRSQQKKKTEAAAQKPAEETSDVTEDDKNLNENRGVEEMETKTESDTTKKRILRRFRSRICHRNQHLHRRGKKSLLL